MADATIQYAAFCPVGDVCGKKQSRLGYFETEHAAREKIYNHLVCSPFHNMDHDDAVVYADTSVLKEEPVDTNWKSWKQPASKWTAAPKKMANKQVDGPYARKGNLTDDTVAAAVSKAVKDVLASSISPSSSTAVAIPTISQTSRTMLAIAKSEQAARTAARMARSAAFAFDEEAAVLHDCLQEFKDSA